MGNTQGEGRGRRAAHGSSACDHEDESSDGSSEERSDCTSSNEDVRQHDDNEPNSCRSWLASIGLCEPDEPGEEGDGTGSRSLKALLPGKEITAHVLRNADGKTGFRLVECSMKVQEIDRTWGNLATLKNGDVVMAVSGHQVRTHEEYQEQVSGLEEFTITVKRQQALEDCYEVNTEVLGTGGYGSVSKCVDKCSGVTRALKNVPKTAVEENRMQKEIDILLSLDHPNVLKLIQTFEDKRFYYLVTELCSGGELFDRIVKKGHLQEREAAIIMEQVLRAVHYMHKLDVSHRDLKPENFLFTTKDAIEKNILKIIDFGLSCKFEKGKVLTTKAGTPYYVAPQVLAGKYDQLSDIWSCGVIMYVMLCGYPPFFGETDAEVLAKVRLGNFSFNAADWKNVSEDAKNLIRMMLKMNPRDRYTAEQALNHEWIKNKAPKAANVSLQANFVDNLRGFRTQNKLKKAALHVIANQLNEDQIKALRDTFVALDGNGDGLLTAAEMKEGLAKAGLKDIPLDLQQILEGVDSDGSGVIDYTEFLAATLDKRSYLKEDVCWSAFRIFDKNGDGKISQDELQVVLNNEDVKDVAGTQAIAELLQSLDGNGDGHIDFEEFMVMMRGTPAQ
mmetsp:Transcript_131636/g.366848  ORF Transcript_131636/g.366848 Transcript_131636/m.366848 type:complete len:617 (+) Transcript_131636:64-1914(+)